MYKACDERLKEADNYILPYLLCYMHTGNGVNGRFHTTTSQENPIPLHPRVRIWSIQGGKKNAPGHRSIPMPMPMPIPVTCHGHVLLSFFLSRHTYHAASPRDRNHNCHACPDEFFWSQKQNRKIKFGMPKCRFFCLHSACRNSRFDERTQNRAITEQDWF